MTEPSFETIIPGRVAYMITGGGVGGVGGHMFFSLEKAERWLSQPIVIKSYGLKEVLVSPKFCSHCRRPTPKLIRTIHKIGSFTGTESPPAKPVS